MRLGVFITAALASVWLGCSGEVGGVEDFPPEPVEPLVNHGSDAGVFHDAGQQPDGGPANDAGAEPDAGPATDGGDKPDAGSKPDAGHPNDAGHLDAGSSADGGAGTDGGVVPGCLAPVALPARASPDAPTTASTCTYMDWRMEPDGFYFISQFGMDTDPTTWGRGTSCGGLISHYMTWCCQYDRHQSACIDGQTPLFMQCARSDPRVPKPPWVKGTVDYVSSTALGRVRSHFLDSTGNLKPYDPQNPFPWPEYFYVAGAQRFNCGSLLRVTNTENGRCIVVYVEDGGPGATYEKTGYAGRRILDSSPALITYLQPKRVGWNNPTMIMVEWGLPGDRPGAPCTPCQSTLAKRGTEAMRTSFDINHYDAPNCRVTVGP